jgi:hypothetical protein
VFILNSRYVDASSVRKLIFWVLVPLMFVGCYQRNAAKAPILSLEGVNGKALYVAGKEGKIIQMFKDEYYNTKFVILLDRDTVLLGDDFSSLFKVHRDSFEIKIAHPSEATLTNDSERYTWTPASEGLYDFTGTIEFDSLSFPFEYKFVVVLQK